MYERLVRRLQGRFHFYLAACMMASALAGCANNPIAIAQTAEQKVFATYGAFVITEKAAAQLTSQGSTIPAATQLKIVNAAQAAQPVVDSMLAAYREYAEARAEFETQRTSQSVVDVAIANLESWATRAAALVETLRVSLRGN